MNSVSLPTSSPQSLSDVPTPTLRAIQKQIPWRNQRRPKQVPPDGDWITWLILSGRGWGKTRVGAEWVLENSEIYGRFVLVGRTAGDMRDIMIEGESGILNVADDAHRPLYEPSKRRLTFPSGAVANLRSADEPETFRGIQAEAIWADELAAWQYPEAWDQMQLGFRLGTQPRQLVTTTPRPTAIIKDLLEDPGTVVTVGSTFENRANLTEAFLHRIVRKYQGTRLERQELHGQILDDLPGALWNYSMFQPGKPPRRYQGTELVDDYTRVVVAVDPAVTYGPESDETGIIVAGKLGDTGYVIEDLSGRFSPGEWAKRVVGAYHQHAADAIVAESNNGGEMVRLTIQREDPSVNVRLVTATKGKRVRAEPISFLYEQGKIFHYKPLPELEEQMCTFLPESPTSPDRMDAAVWALTDLMIGPVYEGPVSMIA